MDKKNRKTIVLAVLGGVLLLLAAELAFYLFKTNREAEQSTEVVEEPTPPPVSPSPTESPLPEFEEYDISLTALGDVIPQMGIVNTGSAADGTLDYSFLFKGDIEEILNKSDIRIISQETVMAGNEHGFSGYPRYNSPTEIADAMAGAGFNAVLCASSHVSDMGLEGLQNCLTYWNSNYPDVTLCGAHYLYDETTERTDRIPVTQIKGVRFAILNYTYDSDADSIPEDTVGRIDYLCDFDFETGVINKGKLNPDVIEDIKAAHKIADIVIVCPHWDIEYSFGASDLQKEWALQMCDAGADVIIGTNPQGPQSAGILTSSDGQRQIPCYYSLGDYVSTQHDGNSILEGAAYLTWHVTKDGITLNERKTGVFPLVCHYTAEPTRMGSVFFLENYTEELASSHGIGSFGVNMSLDKLKKQSDELFADCLLYTDILKD